MKKKCKEKKILSNKKRKNLFKQNLKKLYKMIT